MSHLPSVILGRSLNGESVAKIENIKTITLSQAAGAPTEAVRKQELDASVAGLVGNASTVTNFGLVEDALDTVNSNVVSINTSLTSLDSRLDAVEALDDEQPVVRVFTGAAMDWIEDAGVYTMTIPHTYNTAALNFQMQEDEGAGVWHYLNTVEIEVDVNATQFNLSTTSPTLGAHAIKLIVVGIPVV